MTLTLKEVKFEHEFWLQVLGDHSRFILDSLSPSEKKDIEIAKRFKKEFDQLLNEARKMSNLNNATKLIAEASRLTEELRTFKLSLLERHF